MTDPVRFVAAVLCGGASGRMGVDKAVLELDGRPMALRVADALRAAGADEVLAVGGPDSWAEVLVGPSGCDGMLADGWPGEGPLGGLATLAGARPGATLVVAACDLPDLTPGIVRRLVSATAGATAAVPVDGDRPQWSVLALSPDGARRARAAFAEGQRALRDGVGDAVRVDVGPGPALTDLDDPAALERWRGADGARG